jgi:hypothetical protein
MACGICTRFKDDTEDIANDHIDNCLHVFPGSIVSILKKMLLYEVAFMGLENCPFMYLSCGRGAVWNAINEFNIIIIIIKFNPNFRIVY